MRYVTIVDERQQFVEMGYNDAVLVWESEGRAIVSYSHWDAVGRLGLARTNEEGR